MHNLFRRPLIAAFCALISAQVLAENIATPKTFNKKSFREYFLEFRELRKENSFQLRSDADPVPFSITRVKNNSARNIVVGCVLKGREMGCVPSVVELFKEFAGVGLNVDGKKNDGNGLGGYEGRLTFFFANPLTATQQATGIQDEAIKSFGSGAEQSDEKTRAEQLKKLLTDADLFIEVSHHQGAALDNVKSVLSFPFTNITYMWAKYFRNVQNIVDITKSNSVDATKPMTMTEYARSVGIPAFSLELFPPNESEEAQMEAFQTTKTVVMRAMQGRGHVPDSKNLQGLRDITSELPEIKQLYSVVHSEPFTGFELKLKEGLKNFMPVKAGEVLGVHSESQVELKAPVDGFLFHPKYVNAPVKQTTPATPDAQADEDKEEVKAKPVNAPKYLYQIIQFKRLEEF